MSQFTCQKCGSVYYTNVVGIEPAAGAEGFSYQHAPCVCTACQRGFSRVDLSSITLEVGEKFLVRINDDWAVGTVEFLDVENAVPGIRYGSATDQIASLADIPEAYSFPK